MLRPHEKGKIVTDSNGPQDPQFNWRWIIDVVIILVSIAFIGFVIWMVVDIFKSHLFG